MQPTRQSPSVKAIFVLDSDGTRICAKYFDQSYPTLVEQNELERKLYMKTRNRSARSDTDIIMIEDIIGVFKFGTDVMMYAISSSSENELILSSVLEGTYEAISGMLRGHMDRSVMLENLELILLTIDEVVDGGVILETDAHSISNRVLMRGIDNEVPISDMTISQAFASAKENFFSKSFMKS